VDELADLLDADAQLTKALPKLAQSANIPVLADRVSEGSNDEGALSRSAEWAGTTMAYATRQLAKGVRRAASAVGVAQSRSSTKGRRRSGGSRPAASPSAGRRQEGRKR